LALSTIVHIAVTAWKMSASVFEVARECFLAAEAKIQELKSELVRKDAVITRLRSDLKAAETVDASEQTEDGHSSVSGTLGKLERGIFSNADLQSFLSSPTCQDILAFLGDMNACARGNRMDAPSHPIRPIEGGLSVDRWLAKASALIDETPPEELDPQRFGNKAFRKWHAKLCGALEEEDEELVGYFTRAFGDPHRLDYGTGHEAAFLFLMLVLYKRGKDTQLLTHFLFATFPQYLKVVRRLRLVYRLEPAGSHGVWSLDDYHFLPFVWGSSQLCGGHTKPKDLLSSPQFGELTPDSELFSDALLDILRSKRGPFKEHSPLLHSLRSCASWEDLNAGFMRMWRGEVLGKFPVAQHFLFGSALPLTWTVSNDVTMPSATNPLLPTGQQGSNSSHNDPLAKYFHITAQSHHEETAPSSLVQIAPTHTLLPDGSGIEVSNWIITSKGESRISGEKELDELKERFPNELDFPLPEMLFSNNFLRLEHASGIVLEFKVDEALRGCKLRPGVAPDRRMLKVPMAGKWEQRRDAEGNLIKTWREDYDWTFTTRRLVKVFHKASGEDVKQGRTPRRIDYERLKQREPILWSKEVLLFEDDLFDLGISKLSIKIRVMPSCYFVLARFFLRVDGMHLRVIDSRVFHVFGTKYVLVENSERESEVASLLGGNTETKDLVDPNYVATILPLVSEPVTFEVAV
jgi:serine/threonine-protein phosphatase 2A activator